MGLPLHSLHAAETGEVTGTATTNIRRIINTPRTTLRTITAPPTAPMVSLARTNPRRMHPPALHSHLHKAAAFLGGVSAAGMQTRHGVVPAEEATLRARLLVPRQDRLLREANSTDLATTRRSITAPLTQHQTTRTRQQPRMMQEMRPPSDRPPSTKLRMQHPRSMMTSKCLRQIVHRPRVRRPGLQQVRNLASLSKPPPKPPLLHLSRRYRRSSALLLLKGIRNLSTIEATGSEIFPVAHRPNLHLQEHDPIITTIETTLLNRQHPEQERSRKFGRG